MGMSCISPDMHCQRVMLLSEDKGRDMRETLGDVDPPGESETRSADHATGGRVLHRKTSQLVSSG